MSLNEIIIYLMVIFMILGAIDRIIGNKFGLGQEFESGIMALGSLALAMVGIISLAPVLANVLRPVILPFYQLFGADRPCLQAPFSPTTWAAHRLPWSWPETRDAGLFGGLIVGSMLGPTLVFTIPVALGISAAGGPAVSGQKACSPA